MKIVESIQGVGVVIQSPENAVMYVRQFDEEYTISAMKEGLIEALNEQNQRNNEIKNQLEKLTGYGNTFQSVESFHSLSN